MTLFFFLFYLHLNQDKGTKDRKDFSNRELKRRPTFLGFIELKLNSSLEKSSRKTLEEMWHTRLVHPRSKILWFLYNKSLVDVDSWLKELSICSSCQQGNSWKLLFALTHTMESFIITENSLWLWGPSLVTSVKNLVNRLNLLMILLAILGLFLFVKKCFCCLCFINFKKWLELNFHPELKSCNHVGELSLLKMTLFIILKTVAIALSILYGYTKQNSVVKRIINILWNRSYPFISCLCS